MTDCNLCVRNDTSSCPLYHCNWGLNDNNTCIYFIPIDYMINDDIHSYNSKIYNKNHRYRPADKEKYNKICGDIKK